MKLLRWFFFIILLVSICFCTLTIYITINDIYGTTIEFFTRYPNIEHITTIYGMSRGSNQFPYKAYVYWSPDPPEVVTSYYNSRVRNEWHPQIYEASSLNPSATRLCRYNDFSQYRGDDGSIYPACDILKQYLPKDHGSIIEFLHDWWTG